MKGGRGSILRMYLKLTFMYAYINIYIYIYIKHKYLCRHVPFGNP